VSTDDEYHAPKPFPLAEKAVPTATMKRRHVETNPEVKVVLSAGMKLRYIEIGPEIIAELPAEVQCACNAHYTILGYIIY